MRQRLDHGPVDYQVARLNEVWSDHRARTLVTGALIAWLKPDSILDPACGDGSIVFEATRLHRAEYLSLCDISQPNVDRLMALGPPYPGQSMHVGRLDIAEAIRRPVPGGDKWDIIVLTEILEHLEDPDEIVRLARERATRVVASSPLMRPGQIDPNPEHLWMFDNEGYAEMLADAGWKLQQFTFLQFPTIYDFGVWVCS
jgi:SAM-dependent methyltransferase